MALDLGPGDEVIIPTFTFAATATAFARTGATLVLCDVDPISLMVEPETVRGAINDRTKAVVVVHYGGYSARLDEISAICEDAGIELLEDAAQAFGVERSGRHVGTWGLMGALSFHETKIVHCGQGGALLVNSDDERLIDKISAILARGTNFLDFKVGKATHYEWTSIGSSLVLSELHASILLSQLEEMPDILSFRKKTYQTYLSEEIVGLDSVVRGDDISEFNGHFFAFKTETVKGASELIAVSKATGVNLQSHYKPLHLSKGAREFKTLYSGGHNAENYWSRLVRLPIHTQLTGTDLRRIVDHVRMYLT